MSDNGRGDGLILIEHTKGHYLVSSKENIATLCTLNQNQTIRPSIIKQLPIVINK